MHGLDLPKLDPLRLDLLKLDNVTKVFTTGTFRGKTVTAVGGVSFDVLPGEVVSLIGESGSGKSTIGRMILGLTRPTAGSITLDGAPVRPGRDYYRVVQGVFQDPFSCYNPVFKADRVFDLIKETYYPATGGAEWTDRVAAALRDVRLNPGEVLGKYPHQLSYSLAAVLAANARHLPCGFEVVGVDISSPRLAEAGAGRFAVEQLRASSLVPGVSVDAAFEREGAWWRVRPHLRRAVTFRIANLASPTGLELGRFDVVFCRNVLIYAHDHAWPRFVQTLERALVPGGHLFLGESETLLGRSERLVLRRIGAHFAYVLPPWPSAS
jgi:SAM-dependent methyltransferase